MMDKEIKKFLIGMLTFLLGMCIGNLLFRWLA